MRVLCLQICKIISFSDLMCYCIQSSAKFINPLHIAFVYIHIYVSQKWSLNSQMSGHVTILSHQHWWLRWLYLTSNAVRFVVIFVAAHPSIVLGHLTSGLDPVHVTALGRVHTKWWSSLVPRMKRCWNICAQWWPNLDPVRDRHLKTDQWHFGHWKHSQMKINLKNPCLLWLKIKLHIIGFPADLSQVARDGIHVESSEINLSTSDILPYNRRSRVPVQAGVLFSTS